MEEHLEPVVVRERIKRVIANVTRIPVEKIGDRADFRDDLGLDSLSMLEIGVDVDQEFALGVEDLEDRLAELATVEDVTRFVLGLIERRATS